MDKKIKKIKLKKVLSKKLLNKLILELSDASSRIYDASDVGNEIGFVLGKHFQKSENFKNFISGLNHGIDLIRRKKIKKKNEKI